MNSYLKKLNSGNLEILVPLSKKRMVKQLKNSEDLSEKCPKNLTDNEFLPFLLVVFQLKDEVRTGWEIHDITRPESVADHSFGTAFLSFLFATKKYDLSRCLKLALVHDIHEAVGGDLPSSRIREDEKEQREKEAFEKIIQNLGVKKQEIATLWKEYSRRASEEAKFVKDMDKIDMVLQALFYAIHKRFEGNLEEARLKEFFHSAAEEITTPLGRKVFKTIKKKFKRELTH